MARKRVVTSLPKPVVEQLNSYLEGNQVLMGSLVIVLISEYRDWSATNQKLWKERASTWLRSSTEHRKPSNRRIQIYLDTSAYKNLSSVNVRLWTIAVLLKRGKLTCGG